MTPTPIILDCDPGHDDAIALLLALASPELELVGVTTVSGNHTLDKTTANALRVLEFVGRSDVPVHAGADRPLVREQFVADYVHGETGMDGPDLPPPSTPAADAHAVAFLAEQIRARNGRLTLVPTGPLTNVALLLALEPDARPERIVLMGGAVGEGNRTPAAEFNIWADPEAARRVFESGIDVTMVGLDVTHQALITPAHVEELRRRGRVGTMVAELMDFYARFHRRDVRRARRDRRCTTRSRSLTSRCRTSSRFATRRSSSTAAGTSAGGGRTSTGAAGAARRTRRSGSGSTASSSPAS